MHTHGGHPVSFLHLLDDFSLGLLGSRLGSQFRVKRLHIHRVDVCLTQYVESLLRESRGQLALRKCE